MMKYTTYRCRKCYATVEYPNMTCNCYMVINGVEISIPPTIHFKMEKDETIQEYLQRYNAVDRLIKEGWNRAFYEIKKKK